MRRVTIIAFTTISLSIALPANAVEYTWGPGQTDAYANPTYTLPIVILDGVVETLKKNEHRRYWRQLRNDVLSDWSAGCITFNVVRGEAMTATSTELFVPPMAGGISLYRDIVDSYSYWAVYFEEDDAGVAAFSTRPSWFWQSIHYENAYKLVAHEIGHTLGFNHAAGYHMMSDGEGYQIKDVERQALVDYYCGGTL